MSNIRAPGRKATAFTVSRTVVSLSPDECPNAAAAVDAAVREAFEPQAAYEALLVHNLAAVEREIRINLNRHVSILAGATRASLTSYLCRRADDPAVAGLGCPDKLAWSCCHGTESERNQALARLAGAGISLADLVNEAYLDYAVVLLELRREAGQLERRARLLRMDIDELQARRISRTAISVNGE